MISAIDFIPPVMVKIGRRLAKVGRPKTLFDGSDTIFKREAARCGVYGEYGMGASSRWVLENTNADVVAVDTSPQWVASVQADFLDEPRLQAVHIDLGPTGEWGRPVGFSHRSAFLNYVDAIWHRQCLPDLVLVDGRFRVACFLTSTLKGRPGDRIIFDDYVDRPHYHVVEEFVQPREHCGRQALFEIPVDLNRAHVQAARDQFLMVMD